ncbi:MAG: hypothetical protein NTX03_06180, partial [Bacteroidetes bacterium]|nr:hypothetical protein [Bacteroidota bacterium]
MKKWIDAIKNKLKATHRYWIYGGVSICLLFILSFASATHSSINCRSVDVLITDENEYHFVSQKEILNTLTNQGTEQIVGFPISGIQLKNIENTLLQNSFISSAEAYINMKG